MTIYTMTHNLFEEQTLFSCANPIEPLTCSQCPSFETYNLQHLKRHSKAGHALLESKARGYSCGNCNFRTCSKYLFSRHNFIAVCNQDWKDASEATGEAKALQFREDTGFTNRMQKFRHRLRLDPEKLKKHREKERERDKRRRDIKKSSMDDEALNEKRQRDRERQRKYRENKKKRLNLLKFSDCVIQTRR